METRWVGIGYRPFGSGVGEEKVAAAAVTDALRGPDPAALIVFACGTARPDAVLAGVADAAPGTPVVGVSSEALVTSERSADGGVLVTALGGPGFTVRTGAGSAAHGAQRAAGAAAAGCADWPDAGDDPAARLLVLLTDGLLPGQEEILAGAYGVVGASMPIIGGSASPDPVAGRPYQLHGRDVLTEGAVGIAIASDGPLGVGVAHGWRKVGEPMIVTRSANGDVLTLDDRPALTAYLDRLGAPAAAYRDEAAFEQFAMTRPIGIRRRNGAEVRSVNNPAGVRGRWLRSSGEIPEGGLVWMMEGDEASVLASASDACRDAVDAVGGTPLGLLTFNCSSRRHMLQWEGSQLELARMVKEAAGAPVAGTYTWGEIARTRGINGYHNQTLAVLAVG